MKRKLVKPLITALAILFCAATHAEIDVESTNAALEDYALRSVLENLAVTHMLGKGDIKELKKITYVNLHSHIASLRQFKGNISDKKWQKAKIRALNAIGIEWSKHPPEKDILSDPEWKKIVKENDALIKWAMKECKANPEFKCRSE